MAWSPFSRLRSLFTGPMMTRVVRHYELGDTAKDRITNFTGMVVARTDWINGCVRYTLQPRELDKDNKIQDAQTFDVEQLVLVEEATYEKEAILPARSGGPMPSTPRR